jgi:hypothetical protein
MDTSTTKHAEIATLATELGLPITRGVGIDPMTEAIVTGADKILVEYRLPYVPMIHCFLEYGSHQVDLTEGNRNGKNRPIEDITVQHLQHYFGCGSGSDKAKKTKADYFTFIADSPIVSICG